MDTEKLDEDKYTITIVGHDFIDSHAALYDGYLHKHGIVGMKFQASYDGGEFHIKYNGSSLTPLVYEIAKISPNNEKAKEALSFNGVCYTCKRTFQNACPNCAGENIMMISEVEGCDEVLGVIETVFGGA